VGKKLFLFGVIIGVGVSLFILRQTHPLSNNPKINLATSPVPVASPTPSSIHTKPVSSIFLPYWTLEGNTLPLNGYSRVIYFGIISNGTGIDTTDPGYKKLKSFDTSVSPGLQKHLTIQMTSSDTNLAILNNEKEQVAIISETIQTAQQYGFSGIVLDFELFSLFDNSIPQKINSFVEKFYQSAKQEKLSFAVTLYGDVFYRKRPYDVKFLADHCDEIMIMAYDFHKAIGEPGPNFPLSGKEKYGYDLKVMVDEFLAVIPKEKLSIIFGMYGYDWTVDEKKRPLRRADPLSDNDIRKKYLDNCNTKDCVLIHDDLSKETEIDYVGAVTFDEQGLASSQNHIIWFEDENSARAKQEYLKSRGITSYSYWAAGYF